MYLMNGFNKLNFNWGHTLKQQYLEWGEENGAESEN